LATDHLGSTSLVLDDQGDKVAESRHYPYGEERWRWPQEGTFPTEYRFTGQRIQSGLGLYFMGARQYDPALGRWISADTLVPDPANPQSFNRYAYVRNSPLRFVDPTGYYEEDQIQQYLAATYGETQAAAIWEAWQADPYWLWVLATAQNGDTLETSVGTLFFQESGDSFTIALAASVDTRTLVHWQGTGRAKIIRNGEKVFDPWFDAENTSYGFFGGIRESCGPDWGVYQPIYDYSGGAPRFTGQWLHSSWRVSNVKLNLGAQDGVPAIVGFASWFLKQAAKRFSSAIISGAASGVSGIGLVWTGATILDDTLRIEESLVVRYVPDRRPFLGDSSTGPLPVSVWDVSYGYNPNGPGYPAPP
jgi:RHS repeat-associated protein